MAAKEGDMDGLKRIRVLLDEIALLLQEPTKSSRRAATKKLDDITAIASTLSLTIRVGR